MEPVVARRQDGGVGRVGQARDVEGGPLSITADGEVAGRRRALHELRHRHIPRRRVRRPAFERLAKQVLCPQLDRRREVRRLALVLAVVAHQRLHRDGVLLGVAPAPVLARRHQPPHQPGDNGLRFACAHQRVQRNGGRAHVGIPEVQEVRIRELLDMNRARFRQHRIVHAPPKLRRPRAGLAFPVHGVAQVRDREDRHAIEIAVQTGDVGVLIPPALDEHLHRECLPRGVSGPPAFVGRLLVCELSPQVLVPALHHGGVDVVLQRRRRLIHVQDVAGEIGRHEPAFARPESESAGRALEFLQLAERRLHARPEILDVDPRQMERVAKIGRDSQDERARGALLCAAIRVFDDVACAFAEADEGGRRDLEMQAADARHDAGRHHERLPGIRGRLAVGGHRLGRNGDVDRNGLLERVALVAEPHGRLHASSTDCGSDDIEPDFARRARADLDDATGLASDSQDLRIEAAHRDDGGARHLQLARHDGPEERCVAARHEARKRRLQHHRLVDPDFAFARAESRGLVAADRHDAVRRQRFGQLDVNRGVATHVGRHRSQPERQHAEVLAQLADPALGAASAAICAAFGREHATADDPLAVVGVHHLQGLRHVHRAEHVRRTVTGQREHAVVDGPQRHFARRRQAVRVPHLHVDLGRSRRAVLVPVRFHGDREPLRGIFNSELRVAHAKRRLAWIARIAVGAVRPGTSLDEDDGDEEVGDVGGRDRHRDGLLRRGQRKGGMRPDALALDGQQRRGALPRGLDHQPRRLARLVRLALGYQIHAVVVVPRPGGVTRSDRVKRQARRRRVRAIPRRCANGERAAGREWDSERHRVGARGHREMASLDLLPLGVPGVEPVAFGAAHAVPLHLHQRDVHLHAGDRRAVWCDRHHRRAQPILLIHEHRRPLQPDVPGRRMHDEGRVAGDVLARDILDVAFERVPIGHAVAGPRVEIERELPARIERGRLRRDLTGLVSVAVFAAADEHEPIAREPAHHRERRLKHRRPRIAPRDRPVAHRRPEQIARGDEALERRAGERGIAGQARVDTELGPPIRGDEETAPDDLRRRRLILAVGVLGPRRLGIERLFVEADSDLVIAECPIGRQPRHPFGRAPRRHRDGSLFDDLVAAVANDDVERRPARNQLDPRR